MIDPGHGGRDNGAAWGSKYDYIEEDDLNLSIAFLLRCELWQKCKSFDIKLTRERDKYITLIDRALMANNWGANIFVSIHADAFHNEVISGISVHVHPVCSSGGLDLATKIYRRLTAHFSDHMGRGIKRSDFCVLRQTRMPAALIECEFISNPEMRRFLKEPENQIGVSRAIAAGIVRHFGV